MVAVVRLPLPTPAVAPDAKRPLVEHEDQWSGVAATTPGMLQLHLRGPDITPALFARIVATPLPSLKLLTLRYLDDADPLLALLSRSPLMRTLVGLAVEEAGVGRLGLAGLAETPSAPRLRTLCLSTMGVPGPGRRNAVDDAAVVAFVSGAGSFPVLDDVDLSGNPVGDLGIQRLVGARQFLPALRSVTAWQTGLTAAGLGPALAGGRVHVHSDWNRPAADFSQE